MCFQFELLSLDYLLVDTLYHSWEGITQAAVARSCSEQLLRAFPMLGDVLGSFMISGVPNHDLGLTSRTEPSSCSAWEVDVSMEGLPGFNLGC